MKISDAKPEMEANEKRTKSGICGIRRRFSHRLAMDSETDDQSINVGDYCGFLCFSD